MTIDEAIKRQELFISKTEGYFDDEDISAAKLGIEALKRHQELSKSHPIRAWTPLPGETKD